MEWFFPIFLARSRSWGIETPKALLACIPKRVIPATTFGSPLFLISSIICSSVADEEHFAWLLTGDCLIEVQLVLSFDEPRKAV